MNNIVSGNIIRDLDENGNMISNEVEEYLEKYISNYEFSNLPIPFNPSVDISNHHIEELKQKNIKLLIAFDSRDSSPNIANQIVKGVKKTNIEFPYQVIPYITTPEFHFMFSKYKHQN